MKQNKKNFILHFIVCSRNTLNTGYRHITRMSMVGGSSADVAVLYKPVLLPLATQATSGARNYAIAVPASNPRLLVRWLALGFRLSISSSRIKDASCTSDNTANGKRKKRRRLWLVALTDWLLLVLLLLLLLTIASCCSVVHHRRTNV